MKLVLVIATLLTAYVVKAGDDYAYQQERRDLLEELRIEHKSNDHDNYGDVHSYDDQSYNSYSLSDWYNAFFGSDEVDAYESTSGTVTDAGAAPTSVVAVPNPQNSNTELQNGPVAPQFPRPPLTKAERIRRYIMGRLLHYHRLKKDRKSKVQMPIIEEGNEGENA